MAKRRKLGALPSIVSKARRQIRGRLGAGLAKHNLASEYPFIPRNTISTIVDREVRLKGILDDIASRPEHQFANINKLLGCSPGKTRAEASLSIWFDSPSGKGQKRFDITVLMEGGKTIKQILDNALASAADAARSWGYETPDYNSSANTPDAKFVFNYIDCAPAAKVYDSLTK
jgi:hypothetical protein